MMQVQSPVEVQTNMEVQSEAVYPAEEYFQNTASVVFGFQELQDCLDMETNVRCEIKRLQAHFSQLKMDYLHLETKQGVLEAVSRPDYAKVFEEHQDLSVFQASSNVGKKRLHEVKQEIRALKKKLAVVIPQLAEKWEAYKQEHEDYASSYDKENDVRAVDEVNTRIQVNSSSQMYGKSETDDLLMDGAVKCKRVINNQERTIVDAHRVHDELTAKLQTITEQLAPLNTTVEEMEKQYTTVIQNLAKESKEEGKQGEELGFPYQAQEAWYENAVGVMKALNGFDVEMIDGHSIAIKFALEGGNVENMVISYNEDCTKFVTVEMESGLNVNDIVSYALSTQDLQMLVSEVLQRVRASEGRTAEIKAVMSSWPNTVWEDPILRACLSSPAGDIVQVTLEVCADYPAPHSVIVCKGVGVISGNHSQAKLDSALDTTNHFGQDKEDKKGATLSEFLTHLQNLCF